MGILGNVASSVAGFFSRGEPAQAAQPTQQQQALSGMQEVAPAGAQMWPPPANALPAQPAEMWPPPAYALPAQPAVHADASANHVSDVSDRPYDKAAQMRYACDPTPCHGVDPKQLQADLLNTVVWTGGCCTDYMFFAANWHGFLGILLCHPQHPWTKLARIIAHFVSCALTLLATSISCASAPWFLATVISIWDILYGFYLYQISVIDNCCGYCCKDESTAGTATTCCTRIFQCWQLSVGTCCGLMVFMGAMLISVFNTACSTEELFMAFLQVRLQSYVLWFPLMLFMPCIGFCQRWGKEIEEFNLKTAQLAAAAASQGAANIAPLSGVSPISPLSPSITPSAYAQPGYMPHQMYAAPQQAHMQPQMQMHAMQQPLQPGYASGHVVYRPQ